MLKTIISFQLISHFRVSGPLCTLLDFAISATSGAIQKIHQMEWARVTSAVLSSSHSFQSSHGALALTSHSFASKLGSQKFLSNQLMKVTPLIKLPTLAIQMQMRMNSIRNLHFHSSKWDNNFKHQLIKLHNLRQRYFNNQIVCS